MDERDEVITEFDQTNGKAPELEGDGRADEDGDGDEVLDGEGVLPAMRPLLDVDGSSDERRRD